MNQFGSTCTLRYSNYRIPLGVDAQITMARLTGVKKHCGWHPTTKCGGDLPSDMTRLAQSSYDDLATTIKQYLYSIRELSRGDQPTPALPPPRLQSL